MEDWLLDLNICTVFCPLHLPGQLGQQFIDYMLGFIWSQSLYDITAVDALGRKVASDLQRVV